MGEKWSVPNSVSEVEVVSFCLKDSGSGGKDAITVVSGLLFKSEDLFGRCDNVDGVGSLGLLIFNIGVKGGHLIGHVS